MISLDPRLPSADSPNFLIRLVELFKDYAKEINNILLTVKGRLLSVDIGSASAPSVSFDGDSNTGIYSPGADQLGFATGGTGQMVIDSSGLITIAQGQLKFPATQNASSDANTLDDYEEGTWTPTISGITFTGSNGSTYAYTKIGRMVVLNIVLRASTSVVVSAGASISLPIATGVTGIGSGVLVNLDGPESANAVCNTALIYIKQAITSGANHYLAMTFTYLA